MQFNDSYYDVSSAEVEARAKAAAEAAVQAHLDKVMPEVEQLINSHVPSQIGGKMFFNNMYSLRLRDRMTNVAYAEVIALHPHLFRQQKVDEPTVCLDMTETLGLIASLAAKASSDDSVINLILVSGNRVKKVVQDIMRENGLGNVDRVTPIVASKANSVLWKEDTVDVIFAGWMTHSYLFGAEKRFEQFLEARDNCLEREKGLIFPDQVLLQLQFIADNPEDLQWQRAWKDIPSLKDLDTTDLVEYCLKQPKYKAIKKDQVMTESFIVDNYNLYTVTKDTAQANNVPFKVTVLRSGPVDSFCLHYKTIFHLDPDLERKSVTIEAGTDFTCSVFNLLKPFNGEPFDDIHGTITITPQNGDFSRLNIEVYYQHVREEEILEEQTVEYQVI